MEFSRAVQALKLHQTCIAKRNGSLQFTGNRMLQKVRTRPAGCGWLFYWRPQMRGSREQCRVASSSGAGGCLRPF